jgi:hypothetical protein
MIQTLLSASQTRVNSSLLIALTSSFPPKGPREATGGGGVNGSRVKFYCKNWPMSQVPSPKPKHYRNVMKTATNSIEMVSMKLQMQQKKNGINWTPGYQDMAKTVNEHRAKSPSQTMSRIFIRSLGFLDKVR